MLSIRLDLLKRFDLLLKAIARTTEPVRCLIAGEGVERSTAIGRLHRAVGAVERGVRREDLIEAVKRIKEVLAKLN